MFLIVFKILVIITVHSVYCKNSKMTSFNLIRPDDMKDFESDDAKYGFKKINSKKYGIFDEAIPVIVEHCRFLYMSEKICTWTEFVQGYVNNVRNKNELNKIITSSGEPLSRAYIAYMCFFVKHNYPHIPSEYRLYKNYCPKPCAKVRCENQYFILKDSCKNADISYYDSDYTCECEKPYTWNSDLSNCELDPCKSVTCPYEEKCVYHHYSIPKSNTKYTLSCIKPELIDPCSESISLDMLPGKKACGPNGECFKSLEYVADTLNLWNSIWQNKYELPFKNDTYLFACKCNKGYETDFNFYYPNCALKIADMCEKEKINCSANGFCVVLKNNDVKCSCYTGWTSPDCSIKIAQWGEWSKWSECSPNCSLYRSKNRTRKCSNHNILLCANGTSLINFELDNCASQICEVYGEWTQWSSWSICREPCGRSLKTQKRLCVYNISAEYKDKTFIIRRLCRNDSDGLESLKKGYCGYRDCRKFKTSTFVLIGINVGIVVLFLLYIGYKQLEYNYIKKISNYKSYVKYIDRKNLKRKKRNESENCLNENSDFDDLDSESTDTSNSVEEEYKRHWTLIALKNMTKKYWIGK